MPVIREYGAGQKGDIGSAQIRAPGPSRLMQRSAGEFGAYEGQAIADAGAALTGVAEKMAKRKDQENASDITVKVTGAYAQLSAKLQEVIRTADPGDKTVFEKFDQEVEDTFSKIGEEASTPSAREFFNESTTRIRGQLTSTSMQGQAELAGIKAVNDYTNTHRNLSLAAYSDPSALDNQRQIHAQMVDNLVKTGALPKVKAIELLQNGDADLVKSSIRGWASHNPEYAKQKLDSKIFDEVLGLEGKLQMEGEIDQAIRAREVEQERRRREQERALEIEQKQVQNDFLSKVEEGTLTDKEILSSILNPIGQGGKEDFLNMMKMRSRPAGPPKTDAATMVEVFRRINLPDGDPKKIVDENELNQFVGKGISFTDLNRLRREMQGRNTAAGQVEHSLKKQVMDMAKNKLTKSNPMFGIRDPEGDEQYQKFMTFFLDEYTRKRQEGVPATDLLNPDSQQYLGKFVDQYVRSPQEMMRSFVPKKINTPVDPGTQYQAPKAAPRAPNESAADYLKRIKGGN